MGDRFVKRVRDIFCLRVVAVRHMLQPARNPFGGVQTGNEMKKNCSSRGGREKFTCSLQYNNNNSNVIG